MENVECKRVRMIKCKYSLQIWFFRHRSCSKKRTRLLIWILSYKP